MPNTTRSKLALARRKKLLVQFTRPFEGGSFSGYLLEIGPRFFLLALEGSDGFRFNGFTCLRLKDARTLRVPHKYGSFHEAARKKLSERMPRKPPVEVSSVQALLLSASHKFQLVTIHREQIDADVCYIGRVLDVNRDSVSLLEIGPNAHWDKKPKNYRLREIPRVDFGGQYEESLFNVGGTPNSPLVASS